MYPRSRDHDAAGKIGAGELSATVWNGVLSPSPELLLSLWIALVPRFALLPSASSAGTASPLELLRGSSAGWDLGGARQLGTSQVTPVKLLSWNDLRSHLRHGLPDRSRALRPALIAPWLALGPSL